MSNSRLEAWILYMDTNEDHERFTRLLIKHEPALLRCVLVAVPNRADARDILQECSVALWRRFSDYDEARPFVPWALGFVRIEIRRFLRKSQNQVQLTEKAAELLLRDAEANASELDVREQHLAHCLDRLPTEQQSLINGYYREEHSVGVLSHRSGQTVDAVYKMLQRIRHALHDCIDARMRGAES